MKYVVLLSLLMMTPRCSAARNEKDYPITIQVISSANFNGVQDLDVVIDGQNLELRGPLGKYGALECGDYQAKLVKDQHKLREWKQAYELLLPDNKTRRFSAVRKSSRFIPQTTGIPKLDPSR